MSYVVSLEGFVPPPRFDTVAWASGRVEESTVGPNGPWTTIDTVALSPVDADPTSPAARDFTVTVANPVGWYRVVWIDGSGNVAESGATYSDQSSYQASGVRFADLVARLRAQSAMTEDEAKARINQAHKKMVVDGEAIKARVEIADTIASENAYPLDPDVAQLLSLRVNGRGYDRKSADEIDDLGSYDAYAVGYPVRYFAPEFSASGEGQVLIYPTPTQAGLAITGRAIMFPPDLVNDSDYPSLPADFHEDLVDGALATTLMRDDERLSDALTLEERFKQRTRELRGRMTRRVGSGPARIRVSAR